MHRSGSSVPACTKFRKSRIRSDSPSTPFSQSRNTPGGLERPTTDGSLDRWDHERSDGSPKTTTDGCQPLRADDHCPLHRSAKSGSRSRIRRPCSQPISQEQLAAEVKGIYAGLVMVEAKCINIDAHEKTTHPGEPPLTSERRQTLMNSHRKLLYEHHDFLMVMQHPSASPVLRDLAAKYSSGSRMWKHGIRGFLELLRYRRPASREDMLSFIYTAYQMMSLLFEAVPGHTDTWTECLGDLSRYRMAIEENREIHTTWGGVAERWSTEPTFRHPVVERLYHHVSILERPSMRKFYLYSRAIMGFDKGGEEEKDRWNLFPIKEKNKKWREYLGQTAGFSLSRVSPGFLFDIANGTGRLIQLPLDLLAHHQQHFLLRLRQSVSVLNLSTALFIADSTPRACAAPILGGPHGIEAGLQNFWQIALTLAPLVIFAGGACRVA